MPLIYVTGVEGAGKSTICNTLTKMGYNAVDIDTERLTHRYYRDTWEPSDSLPDLKNSKWEWYNQRQWKIKPSDVLLLKNKAMSDTVYMCGITDNFDDIKELPDKIVCLTLLPEQVIERATTREDDFGKNQAQLDYILKKQKQYEDDNEKFGSVMIDASASRAEVIDAILKITNTN